MRDEADRVHTQEDTATIILSMRPETYIYRPFAKDDDEPTSFLVSREQLGQVATRNPTGDLGGDHL